MPPHVASDTRIMRGINAAAVLDLVRRSPQSSVKDLATTSGLSRQAVTRALSNLETVGLIRFVAPSPGTTRSGRPAQQVEFSANLGTVVAVSASAEEITSRVCDLQGQELSVSTIKNPGTDLTPHMLLRAIQNCVTDAGIRTRDVWAVALAVPGIIDAETGIVRACPSARRLEGTAIRDELTNIFGDSIITDNDLKLAAIGEQFYGQSLEDQTFVLIEWGERVGAGIVVNGQLHRGASNDAGDLGYLQVPATELASLPEQTVTTLGQFERWVGGAEFVRLTRDYAVSTGEVDLISTLDQLDSSLALSAITAAASAQSPAAKLALNEVARRFCRGINAVQVLLDPDVIIIGGKMAAAGDALMQAIQHALPNEILNPPRIALSKIGTNASIMGATRRALDHVDTTRFSADSLNNLFDTMKSSTR